MADTQSYTRNAESLSADLIAQRGFVTSRRGFDPDEVRRFLGQVASEVRHLRDRLEQLDAARREAEERARHPKLDEETILAAVGQETVDVLRSAQSAASEIRKRAEEAASGLLRDAQAQAQALRDDAESTLGRITSEAESQAEQIRGVANTDAERTRSVSRQEADAVRRQADQERRLTVEAAQNVRERILGDLARRRRVASVQIEQLRAGRERLLDAYLVVRRTLEEVTDELQRADAEARAASDAVGEQMGWDPDKEVDLLADQPLPEVPPVPEVIAGREERSDTAPQPAMPAPPAPPAPPPSPAGGAVSPQDVVITSPESPGSTASDESRPGTAPAAPVASPPAPSSSASAGAVRILSSSVETTPRSGRSRSARRRAAVVAEPAEESEAGANGDQAPAGDQVDGMFERLRAGETGAQEEASGAEEDNADEATPDGDELLLQQRDRAVGGIEMRLARRLKRALQDEQNDLLDRLRNRKSAPVAARILPTPNAQRDRIAKAARPLLQEASRAGVTYAHSLFEAAPSARGGSSEPRVDDLPPLLAAAIAEPLRQQLEQAFTDATTTNEDDSELVESIGAAYREWKTQRIEESAGDHVAAAFSRGSYATIPDGRTVRWLVEDLGGPCPDCDDNILAGSQAKGEEFPTGQLFPPAHAGCRCVLVPGDR